MRRDELKDVLSAETQQIVARLVRDNECPDDWSWIGYRRDQDEVLVSVGYEPDHTVMIFRVLERDWPQVEPWWTQGSAFSAGESP